MGSDYARHQLIARATYLPKGYLVAAATYLRCATVSVGHYGDPSPLRLRYQLVAAATYLRFATVRRLDCAGTSRYREVTSGE
jgi:hypothetical protein